MTLRLSPSILGALVLLAGGLVCGVGLGEAAPDASGEIRPKLDRSYRGSAQQTVCRPSTPLLVPRPNTTVPLDRVVVHYARTGPNAVPSADKDHNGVPDYVECVEAAASRALETYRLWSLRPPSADREGGDSRPDIYLVRLQPNESSDPFGAVQRDAHGTRFVVLSTKLEPSEPTAYEAKTKKAIYEGLWFALAHEMFHVVQSAYVPLELIPGWIKEGTANAWMLLATGAASVAAAEQIDAFLRDSWNSLLASKTGDATRGYGSIVYWIYFQFPPGIRALGLKAPGSTGALFELLARAARGGVRISDRTSLPDQAFRLTYPTFDPSHPLFERFVNATYTATAATEQQDSTWRPYPLAKHLAPVSDRSGGATTYQFKPLSAARIPITVPSGQLGRILEVRLTAAGAGMIAVLNLGGRFGVQQEEARAGHPVVWRVYTGAAGAYCGLGGEPTQLDSDLWSDPNSADPEAPKVSCVKGAVDIVASNSSSRANGTISFTYQLLPASTEVPGRDRDGDVPAGSLDLSSMGVAATRDRVSWVVNAQGAALSDAMLQIFVDPDENPSTGAQPGGYDYLYEFNGPSSTWKLSHFEAGSWATVGSGSATISQGAPFPLSAWVTPTGLGDPLRARFVVRAWRSGDDFSHADVMPSSGNWELTTWRGYWAR